MGEITLGGKVADPAPDPLGDSLGVDFDADTDADADALDEARAIKRAAGVDDAVYFATSSSILLSPLALPAAIVAEAAAAV